MFCGSIFGVEAGVFFGGAKADGVAVFKVGFGKFARAVVNCAGDGVVIFHRIFDTWANGVDAPFKTGFCDEAFGFKACGSNFWFG